MELQASSGMPCPSPPSAGPTGAREAALASCKKKYKRQLAQKRAKDALTKQLKQRLKKKLRKCRRRENQLPV